MELKNAPPSIKTTGIARRRTSATKYCFLTVMIVLISGPIPGSDQRPSLGPSIGRTTGNFDDFTLSPASDFRWLGGMRVRNEETMESGSSTNAQATSLR